MAAFWQVVMFVALVVNVAATLSSIYFAVQSSRAYHKIVGDRVRLDK